MKTFCTSCGSSLNPGATFCTGCGAPAGPPAAGDGGGAGGGKSNLGDSPNGQATDPDEKKMELGVTRVAAEAPLQAAPAKSAGDIPANAPADRTQLSMFKPPQPIPKKSEMISVGNWRFIMVDGQWMSTQITDQDMLDIEKKNAQDKNLQCHALRDEAVAGDPAALYAVHHETGGTQSDEQIWISRRSGLPLKLELDLHPGAGKSASHMSSTMSYDNVRAPQGVKQ